MGQAPTAKESFFSIYSKPPVTQENNSAGIQASAIFCSTNGGVAAKQINSLLFWVPSYYERQQLAILEASLYSPPHGDDWLIMQSGGGTCRV